MVSTSSQKALVWNLGMINTRSSIEHALHAHTRAITDINFSAHDPDLLATCSVDSFVHCWDLRTPSRPSISFSDWFAAATQVKWNRQDPHILASSHNRHLRIWDSRKGAYPLRSIDAHSTKIYGIDWSRTDTTKLITCSLDHTIKFWDYEDQFDEPEHILNTPYPVWRARYTPFGHGLLAMPQREDHDLHLYDRRLDARHGQDCTTPSTHTFEGHEDQIKEFLWRPRGMVTESKDDREFQLVSWGTDHILRLHHVNEDVLESVGYRKGMDVARRMNFTRRGAVYKTFRESPAISTGSELGEAEERDNSRSKLNHASGFKMTTSFNNAQVPFVRGYGHPGSTNPHAGRKQSASNDLDPIAWMRGVRIGKRDDSPSALHHSVSSIISPTMKQHSWDTFENLGDEITHAADKFKKVSFEEVRNLPSTGLSLVLFNLILIKGSSD